MNKIISSGAVRRVHVMCTINALCLDSLPKFLDWCLNMKQQYGRDYPSFTLNILRFPSFQSPLVLSDQLRIKYRDQLIEFLTAVDSAHILHEHEHNHLQRLIDYLDVVKTPHSEAFDMPRLHNDFKQFYTQYDQRRGKNFTATFPNLKEWYESIQL
jgi:hypothetical protein